MRLWQNAGLATDDQGFLPPFSPLGSPGLGADVEEDTKANALTWLIGKIANHLTSGDALVPTDYALPQDQRPKIGVTQDELLIRWNALLKELGTWRANLPLTCSPTVRTAIRDASSKFTGFDSIWYSLPICAGLMHHYHMASILLLVNQPQESTAVRSTVSARLKSYRQIQREAHVHAREICGISLADPTPSVRINSVHSLFVAGQVFHQPWEQEVVLWLLRGIESDLGYSTSYHVNRLIYEWQC